MFLSSILNPSKKISHHGILDNCGLVIQSAFTNNNFVSSPYVTYDCDAKDLVVPLLDKLHIRFMNSSIKYISKLLQNIQIKTKKLTLTFGCYIDNDVCKSITSLLAVKKIVVLGKIILFIHCF